MGEVLVLGLGQLIRNEVRATVQSKMQWQRLLVELYSLCGARAGIAWVHERVEVMRMWQDTMEVIRSLYVHVSYGPIN